MSLDANVDTLVQRLADDLLDVLNRFGRNDPLMVGIHTGGAWVAERLRDLLPEPPPLGTLNINFYRDDFTQIGLHPRVTPSHLPFSVDDRHVILVDDVLFTGRTIRAAMNELFDYGRPASVTLAVLLERGGRELPVHADAAGARPKLKPGQYLKLTGPEPLELVVQDGK